MSNPKLKSSKLVLPAEMYSRRKKMPAGWLDVLGKADYSILVSGRTGSGKDALTILIMNIDMMHNRTPIVLDIKMEYAHNIFCQNDVVLANLLRANGMVGRGYPVILWIPYIQGMEKNGHFLELLKYHHPNLEIRPFRIRVQDFASEDSYNLSLQKTHLQSAAVDKTKLTAQSKRINDIKDEMARRMGFDDHDKWEPNCGWEYINFNEMTTNKKINDICTFFLSKNNIIATSYGIAITNDLITIGKGIDRVRNPNEVFTVTFPEVEVILPKGVKALDASVDTLRFNLRTSLKLMRFFNGWYRMNLQNLSVLDPDMVSQTMPFAGRTWNYKDINILGMFGLSKKERILISQSKVGTFHDVINKRSFSGIPFSHKARAGEYMLKMLREYNRDPSLYLFETENYFLSEIINWPIIFTEGRPLTIQEYNRRVKRWIDAQPRRSVMPIKEHNPNEIIEENEEQSSDDVMKRIKKLMGQNNRRVVKEIMEVVT